MESSERREVRAPRPVVRALLVEDNDGDAVLTRLALEQSVSTLFECQHVGSLADALQALGSDKVDLAIVDLSLPDSQGLDTLHSLHEAHPELPFIVVTGHDDEALSLRAGQMGAQGYLVKDQINTSNLVRSIRHAIDRHKLMIELDVARRREQHHATHDPLTDLPNRTVFLDRLEQAISTATRTQQQLALFFIDLDRFKQVNDSLGHRAGDELLRSMAQRIQGCLRRTDTAVRLGGDEFAVLLTCLRRDLDAARVAGKVLAALAEPIRMEGRTLSPSASVGVAIFPNDGREPETLVQAADTAMYEAKQAGGGRFRFYESAMGARAGDRLEIEDHLRTALSRRELVLHYQPIFDASRDRVVRVEALLRWRHPEMGLLTPSRFLELARELRLMPAIGGWVVLTACRDAASWGGHPSVSVNVDPQELQEQGFADAVRRALDESALPARSLILELTETAFLQNGGGWAREQLKALRAEGVRIALDDFGAGHAALGTLTQLPVDELKLARSFVADLPRASGETRIAQSIIRLARELSIEPVAEGVEKPEQRDFLLRSGCPRMQGFLLARPMGFDQLVAFLGRRRVPAGSSDRPEISTEA